MCRHAWSSTSRQLRRRKCLGAGFARKWFENDGKSVVAIYHTHTDADRAVKELQRGGVDMHKLSIVGKGYHTDEQVVGYYNTGDRMKYWGKVGAFWGGFWALLFGSAMFVIPGSAQF
jgi:hypothetical protein